MIEGLQTGFINLEYMNYNVRCLTRWSKRGSRIIEEVCQSAGLVREQQIVACDHSRSDSARTWQSKSLVGVEVGLK
jgi:hypothetical protein